MVTVNAREVTRQNKYHLHHIFLSVPNNVETDDTRFEEPSIGKQVSLKAVAA